MTFVRRSPRPTRLSDRVIADDGPRGVRLGARCYVLTVQSTSPTSPLFGIIRRGGLHFGRGVHRSRVQMGGIATIGLRHAGDTPTEIFYGCNSPNRAGVGGRAGGPSRRAGALGRGTGPCRRAGVQGRAGGLGRRGVPEGRAGGPGCRAGAQGRAGEPGRRGASRGCSACAARAGGARVLPGGA